MSTCSSGGNLGGSIVTADNIAVYLAPPLATSIATTSLRRTCSNGCLNRKAEAGTFMRSPGWSEAPLATGDYELGATTLPASVTRTERQPRRAARATLPAHDEKAVDVQ